MVFGLSATLGACGDSQPSSTESAISNTVVAALGDSITAGNPAYDPDPAQRDALGFGDDETSQYEYWAQEADPGLEFRNCGVFGERTDEIAQRFDECADGADTLIVQGGINDVAQARPVSAAAADLRSMVERGEGAGLETYLVDVLPWNNGHPIADERIEALNREIDRIGADTGVEVIEWHDLLEDPGEPGVMTPGLTADGDHPSIDGYRRLGEAVAMALGNGQ